MNTICLRLFCEKTIEALSAKVMEETTPDAVKNNFVTEPTKRGEMFYFCLEVK